MNTSRLTGRAAALLATTALAAGLVTTAAPALASADGHTVSVRIGSSKKGWTASLSCTPAGGGAAIARQASAVTMLNLETLSIFQLATFTHVPNATRTVSAASTSLVNVGSVAQSGVTVSKDLTVLLTVPTAALPRLRLTERLAGEHVLVGVTDARPGSSPGTAYSQAVKVRGLRQKEGF